MAKGVLNLILENLEFHVILTRHKHIPKGRINYLWNSPQSNNKLAQDSQASKHHFYFTPQNPSLIQLTSFAQTIQSCCSFLQSNHHDPCLLISIPTQSFLHQNPKLMILSL
jgi:hypothetical protein